MTTALIVNNPAVVSEVIDGELVVMNLTTGNYFSSDGVGPQLWAAIEEGLSVDALAAALVSAYGIAANQAQADVARFVQQLRAEGLVREGESALNGTETHTLHAEGAYAAPQLTVYSDMRDLLVLDPIHDVAEEGWPVRPSDLKSPG